MNNYVSYLFFAVILGFFVRRWILFRSVRIKLPEYLKAGAVIVDVRSPAEYFSGHVKGSINIPLEDLAGKASALDKSKMVLLCCASGSRSGVAVTVLKRQGFNKVINAGSWSNLTKYDL